MQMRATSFKVPRYPSQIYYKDIKENGLLLSDSQIQVVKKWFAVHPELRRCTVLKHIHSEENRRFIVEHFGESMLEKMQMEKSSFTVEKVAFEKNSRFLAVYYGQKAEDHDHIKYMVGKGGYGKVKLAQDIEDGSWFSYKVSTNKKHNTYDKNISEVTFAKKCGLDSVAFLRNSKNVNKALMVLPFAYGEDFQHLKSKPHPEDWWLKMMINVAIQLKSMHELNVIHNDIKPANLILDQVLETVSVIDYGLANDFCHLNNSRSTRVVGTHGFMAPEVYQGFYTDKSDVYALGATFVLLLELGEIINDQSKKRKIKFFNPSDAAWHYSKYFRNDVLRETITALCQQMMDDDPKNRPTMNEVIQTLCDLQLKIEVPLVDRHKIAVIDVSEYMQLAADEKILFAEFCSAFDRVWLIDEAQRSIHIYVEIMMQLQNCGAIVDQSVRRYQVKQALLDEIAEKGYQFVHITNEVGQLSKMYQLAPEERDDLVNTLKYLAEIDARLQKICQVFENEKQRISHKYPMKKIAKRLALIDTLLQDLRGCSTHDKLNNTKLCKKFENLQKAIVNSTLKKSVATFFHHPTNTQKIAASAIKEIKGANYLHR